MIIITSCRNLPDSGCSNSIIMSYYFEPKHQSDQLYCGFSSKIKHASCCLCCIRCLQLGQPLVDCKPLQYKTVVKTGMGDSEILAKEKKHYLLLGQIF